MMLHRTRALLAIALVAGLTRPAIAAEGDAKITPGEFVIEHPTLINLGFEWHVDGDANRNSAVAVSYRKQGETAWRAGLPLVRLHGEQVFQRNVFNLVTPNMFAGSILDLEPGTAYEARLVRGARFQIEDAAGKHVRRHRVEHVPLIGLFAMEPHERQRLLPGRLALLPEGHVDARISIGIAVDTPLESEVDERGVFDHEFAGRHLYRVVLGRGRRRLAEACNDRESRQKTGPKEGA